MATLKELYDALKADGAPLPDTYDKFKTHMESSYENRKQVYDALKADGAPLPDTYDEFRDALFTTIARDESHNIQPQAQPQTESVEPTSSQALQETIEFESNPVAKSQSQQANEPSWQPTWQDKVRMQNAIDSANKTIEGMNASVENVNRLMESRTPEGKKKMKLQEDIARSRGIQTKPMGILKPDSPSQSQNGGEGNTGDMVAPIEGARFHSMTWDKDGNYVPQWIMPDGSLTTSFVEADKSVTAARQERNRLANLTTASQLKNAQKELDDLNRKINERTEQNRKKQSTHPIYNGSRPGSFSQNYNHLGDEDIKQWTAAKHQVEERISKLEKKQEEENGQSRGFWRGVGDVISDFRTWDFGLSDLKDATSALQINNKLEKGQELTEAEKDRMAAMAENQSIDHEGSWMYRMGQMSGEMLPFMLDFTIMGGAKGGSTAMSKALTGYLSKQASKIMPEVAKKKAAQWTIKVLGTMPEDLLVRAPLMTNTVQAGKTTSDIIDRKLGDVVVKEDGTYDFSKDKNWSSAIWQGEADAIIENYSEMFGTHLEAPVGKLAEWAGKGLDKVFGAGRISGLLARAGSSDLANIANRTRTFLRDNMGVSDYLGEVGEEYYGQIWRTMLGLDEAYRPVTDENGNPVYKLDKDGNPILDENGNPIQERRNLLLDNPFKEGFHGDIWGGMALSMGLLHGGTMALNYGGHKASKGINYMNLRHRVNKADKAASTILTPDIWEGFKSTIDNTDNDHIGEYADRIVNDPNLTDEQRAAIMNYMEASLNMRGFNLASMAQQRGGEINEDEANMDESYIEGYSATTPEEMNDVKRILDLRREMLKSSLSEDAIASIDENPLESLSNITEPELRQNVLDYINAKMVYDGMLQRVRDDIDSEFTQADLLTDQRTNKDTGMVQPATMKLNDRPVYIVKGNVVMFDDGSGIDQANSDQDIWIIDAETGKLEMTYPGAILNIGESIDPEQEKEAAREAIRQEKAQAAANNINGVVQLEPGESYLVLTPDGEQKNMAVLWNTKDENGMPIAGMFDVELPDGTITSMAEADIQAMIEEARAKRVADFEAERNSNGETEEIIIEETGNIPVENIPENGNNGIENIPLVVEGSESENVPTEGEIVPPTQDNIEVEETVSAMSQIPVDEETGKPKWHESEPETTWDALVEETGDEETAMFFAQNQLNRAEKEVKKAEKVKPLDTDDLNEFKNSEIARKSAIDNAKAIAEHWRKVGQIKQNRQRAIEEAQREAARIAAEEARAKAEQQRAEREEAERIEREKLNGVPDWSQDTPADARARGYRRNGSGLVERQEPLEAVTGNEVNVKFSDKEIPSGKVAVIEAENLQPSHIQGQMNPGFFIDEAQPKKRTDAASVDASRKIASNIRPEEITSSVTAYTGAPTVNSRGEVIQGNNRSDALRLMWESYKEQGEKYRQYLIDHAEELGLDVEAIRNMKNPVLVNMLDVADEEAIRLGQYGQTDIESGGVERIKPKQTVQKMGKATKNFANILLHTSDDESSFSSLVDQNGVEALKWMSDRGYITPTQYKSAFDSKGNLTGEAANDLKGILYQTIFTGGSTQLEEMFNTLPAKAQRALLATAFRDHDSANEGKMLPEIQKSIMAFNMLMGYQPFMEAKNLEDAKRAAEEWKRSYAFDEVTGESILPSENFSNFAIELAARFKGHTQSHIQGLLNEMFDVIQGAKEDTLFEEADKTPKTLAEAIKIVLDMEYQPVKKNNDNGQNGSDNVAINGEDGETGGSRSSGGTEGREQSEEGTEPADSGRGTETDSREGISSEETPTSPTIGEKIAEAEAEVNTEPTEKQKEAGNYKMGHVKIGKFDMTIENPKGSVRSGVDADGKAWSVTMQHTYGYIKGTKGVDGDHIDVYASSDIDGWNGEKVFVIDQYNPDGSFDEHKVMLGFNDKEEAYNAYLSNYEKDWEKSRRIDITEVSTPEFEKWIDSSKRKTKPFAEYKSVKTEASEETIPQTDNTQPIKENPAEEPEKPESVTDEEVKIEEGYKTPKKKKEYVKVTLPRVEKAEWTARNAVAKKHGGFSFGGGYLFNTREEAEAFVEAVMNPQSIADEKPLSLADLQETVTPEITEQNQEFEGKSEQKNPSGNKLVTDEAYAELLKRMRQKLGGQLNMGIDPEILAIGAQMAIYHIEKGARKFADYVKAMIADLGEKFPAHYLKGFYNNARDLLEVEAPEMEQEMTPYDEVRRADVATIINGNVNAFASAEMVVKEQKAEKEKDKAEQKLKEERNKRRRENSHEDRQTSSTKDLKQEENSTSGKQLPLLKQYEEMKKKHPDAILLFRVGDFYEVFKQDAKDTSDILGITLTKRSTGDGSVEMAGFPHHALDSYLPKLVKAGRRVAICEQLEDPKLTKRPSPADTPQPKEAVSTEEATKQALETLNKFDGKKNNNKKPVKSEANQGSLFNFEEETNTENNDLRRNDGPRTEGLPANNSRQSEGHRENSGEKSEGTRQTGERTDRRREGSQAERTGSLSSGLPRLRESERKNTRNNHAERGKDYAPKGEDARIKANIEAIELAQRLLESGETATPEQMEVLRKFSGWGGLGKAFSNEAYSNKLKQLLGDQYQEAVESRKSAFYTPAPIIDTLWDIAKALGFKGGKVLEGSAGIGNILGLMPRELSERSEIQAVEVDPTTGGILSLLYPDAQVDIKGFEETQVENGSVDLSITNVPFITGWNVIDTTGDKDLSKKFKDIHDFCIAKNIRKLREGGIGIFITSNATLDNSTKLRAWITNEGNSDVVGAFRLNNETFGGTGTTSDIIIVRKRINGRKSPHAIDISESSGERNAEFDTGETRKKKVDGTTQEIPVIKNLPMDYNRYFIEHPENMGGEMHFGFEKGDTYRPTSKGLYPVKGKSQEQLLKDWADRFNDMDFEAVPERIQEYEATYDKVGNEVKYGSLVVDDRGRLCFNSGGVARPLMSPRKNKQDNRTDEELISLFNNKKIKGRSRQECLKDYNAIKKALKDVLDYQKEHEGNEGLEPLLKNLNKAFDTFVQRYGNFHKNNQLSWLKNDVDYPSVLALETFEEKNDNKGNRVKVYGKTDIFKRRVVGKETEPQPKNIKDGILASMYISGRLDVGYIAEKLNMPEEKVKEEIVASGLGFENPVSREMEVSYEYLSGNVREKLRQAQENNSDGKYDANIKALEKTVPMNIPAHLIEFTLGSSWITPKLYEDYIREKTGVDVKLSNVGGTWFMKAPEYGVQTEQNRSQGVYSEMLRITVFGHQIIDAAITNRQITVSRTHKNYDGSTETITDREATAAVSAKVDEFRQDFKDWARAKMQSDPAMSEQMEKIYNERFNNSVPMNIPDEFVPEHFGGQVSEMGGRPFSMRTHQSKAAIRGTTQSILLAHEVGTGKTFTLITTAMEMRRLGTARKPMIIVQNATVGQFVDSAKELYPNAKILTLEDADRNAQGRKDFYAKIKYNDWDMIVIPQSVLDMIPDSEERQIRYIQDIIDEKMLVLEQMKEEDPEGKSWIAKQAQNEIDKKEAELAAITEALETKRKKTAEQEKRDAQNRHNAKVRAMEMLDRATDDVENFDDMGIDALLVDEAHEYKHLGFATAMQRGVKGVDPSYSKKAQGLYLKTQAIKERNNGKNVIFATGTPISNTAAEIWTFMRYLMPEDEMKEYGIYYFDDFVRNFGNLQQMLEFATNGKFKENNRFAGYVNLPELVRIWSTVADTVLTREAGEVANKIPEMEGGKAQDIYLPQTKALRSVMLYVKSQLDKYDKMSGKEKKANSHIPLTMYGIAKAAAVDARLVYSDATDDPQSKTNEAVRQTLKSLEDSKGYKGTVAIFADNYQNKESGFNLYEDIKKKLINEGVPEDQIVVMKPGMTVKKKVEIFDKVNAGDVRVILGSTYTLGTGVNIQERLHTLIHLDAPNRPMDYTQRNGRILRQGNLHKEMGIPVRVLRFGVEDSLDVTAYQRLKTKGAIADSIMNGKYLMENSMENRMMEEEEDVFGDITAQLSGSEYAMLKNQAEKEVRKLNSQLKQWESDQTYIHNQIPRLKGQIRKSQELQDEANNNLNTIEKFFPDGKFKEIKIGNQTFTDLEGMAKYFTDWNKVVGEVSDNIRDNKISGPQTRKLSVDIDGLKFEITTVIDKEMGNQGGTLFSKASRKVSYSCPQLEGVTDVPVSGARLKGAIEDIVTRVITGKQFSERAEAMQTSIERNQSELENLEKRKGKEFEHYKELEDAQNRLNEYTEKMKAELAAKEAKYAEMDSDVEALDEDSITLSDEDSEEANETEDNGDEAVRFRFAEEGNSKDFDSLREQAINEKGIVMPGLAEKEVEIVNVPRHDFNSDKPIEEARDWAKDNIQGRHYLYDSEGKKVEYDISNKAIKKFLSRSSVENSIDVGTHLAVLKKIPQIIESSIEAELHADYLKGESGRNQQSQIGDDVLIHRFYGAAEIDGEIYRVKTTIQERKGKNNVPHAYEVIEIKMSDETSDRMETKGRTLNGSSLEHTKLNNKNETTKIELLDNAPNNSNGAYALNDELQERRTANIENNSETNKIARQDAGQNGASRLKIESNQATTRTANIENNSENRKITGAELLNGVEKSYDKGVKLLDASTSERGREGEKIGYTDAEISEASDPWAKAWGGSFRSRKQQEKWADRERKRMKERAKSLGKRLGLNIEIREDSEGLEGKKARAKGWYDVKTGKITVIVGNHTSVEDMEKTILHEAVAHHGLRELLGEHFDEFLDKVYWAAELPIRQKIAAMAFRKGWNLRVATEEYLAGLAEETEFEGAETTLHGWFNKIKNFFIDMLFKAGFKHLGKESISDNELRYVLWRSYQNLANPGRYRAFEWEAQDVAMKDKLGVLDQQRRKEERRETGWTRGQAAEASEPEILYRDGDFTRKDAVTVAKYYEEMVNSGRYQFREAVQDSMLGLKTLYEAVLKDPKLKIEDIAAYENAYIYENRMSSTNAAEQQQYFTQYIKPLLKAISNLCGKSESARREMTDYMMAKHGLERNAYMRAEAAKAKEKTERDFAGLTALTGEDDWEQAELLAQDMVDQYEADHDMALIDELWRTTKEATQETLTKLWLSGIISEETLNNVSGMYAYYIPLRGWDQTTSDEVYGYLTSKDGPLRGNVMKSAEGRSSKADDPIATIAMMADDAIRQGNRNIMKQRFLNFAWNNPSDLVSVSELWLEHDDVTDEWVPVFADLTPDMTTEEVANELEKFEAKMEGLMTTEPDKYKKGRNAINIPYKVVKGNLNEHQVIVKRNGRTYVMTINGNPRAAQALNGLTNPDVEQNGVIGNMLKLGQYVNRQLSAFYTTRNPDFVAGNFLRDMLYSNCMTWVKENPRYAMRFHKNFGRVNPATLRGLIGRWEEGRLRDSNYLEKQFKDFMLNGGETGYTSVKDIEGHKRTIAKELKANGSVARKAWKILGLQLDMLNRSAENCARFAAFLTSREMGRSLDRSIYDAKEISVNFNKKGSGGKMVNATGQTTLGKVGSYLSGGGRIAYVFWNAGVQGMTNFGRAFRRHPAKALGGAAALFTFGMVIPLLAKMMGGGDGDDDDKNAYYNLPEYIRRSNICFKAGDQWITIPLPIEYRSLYGLGELTTGLVTGNERYSDSELALQTASQFSQLLPLDMLEGGGGVSPFIPSAFKPFTEAYIMNKGWTGMPVYKENAFNKNDPEWSKAYASADQTLVDFARWLNETTGGDDYKKGKIDINPAKLEYLLNGTFGGIVSFPTKLKKSGETILGDREFDWRNIPLANRVVKSGDERTANRKLLNEYYKYYNENDETARLLRKYENAANEGVFKYAEKMNLLWNSNENLRHEIFEAYNKELKNIGEAMKGNVNPEIRKELENLYFSLMREMINEIHKTEKGIPASVAQ